LTEAESASLENRILRARARGEVSADAAFEELYREYARTVLGWLSLRAEASAVDDLAQDVWLIFYSRFRRWEFGTEMESPEARPVLSFLFRTCHFVARARRRLATSRKTTPLGAAEDVAVVNGRHALPRAVEANRALALARRICSEEELSVLLGKIVGLSAREIASALSMTEAVVDHRFRDAIGRLRREMKVDKKKEKGRG
jgi:DNA-directed RNA polymerase specialized sigma24 family protein